MNASEKALEHRRRLVASRMESFVKTNLKLRWWKLKLEDEYRLIRLLQWEEKYQVSMEWMLHLLLPIWKKMYGRYQRNGIGVTIATLTGKKSEEIVVQHIQEEFPDRENREQWKARQQTKQFESTKDIPLRKLPEGMDEFLQGYLARMARQRVERSQFARKMRRRNWRMNPWL